MKQILIRIALLFLITATAAGCSQRDQTKTVNGYTVVAASGATFAPADIAYDGKVTTIQLQTSYRGEPPGIFVMPGDYGADTLRYRWDGQRTRFVVDGQVGRAVLALEDKRVTITIN